MQKYEGEGKLLKMSEKQSVFLPEGYFEVKAIPQAEIADIYVSKELITDNELDSFYFKALEEKKIYQMRNKLKLFEQLINLFKQLLLQGVEKQEF
ncbi:hypothetical protein BG03_5646 (plasmid) [Bacillus cereus]|uniref:hypothetical protein n=1 Tax=Bacillus tropicus TaxID=2026188 RepID=UPI0005A36E58|nr:hypothetical protein [Bacillus tropicus]AJG91353.1 hypothetical protein BG03_5646 [Bacillus cereus]